MAEPLRIQRRRTRGWRLPENTVCVSRGTMWGNPFRIGPALESAGVRIPEMTAETAVSCYADYLDRAIANWSSTREALRNLSGRNLACWCRLCPLHKAGKRFAEPCSDCAPCHSDIIGQRVLALRCEATDA